MKIGILSDTHGHVPRTREALRILREADVGHLIHCGDLGGEEVVTLLFEELETGCPVTAVPGNVDEWDSGLVLYAKKLGLPLPKTQRLEIDNLQIAVCHGHIASDLDRLARDGTLDLLFTGHTHVPKDDDGGPVRTINPGAVYRAAQPGVAIFDTKTRTCRHIPLAQNH